MVKSHHSVSNDGLCWDNDQIILPLALKMKKKKKVVRRKMKISDVSMMIY
jgi:hypothetical protein